MRPRSVLLLPQFKIRLSLRFNGVAAVAGAGADGAIGDGVTVDGAIGVAGAAAGVVGAGGMEADGTARALASWSVAVVPRGVHAHGAGDGAVRTSVAACGGEAAKRGQASEQTPAPSTLSFAQ
jgi:hypothetical protein